LSVATAVALYKKYEKEVNYCFDRKEVKDHGEGGMFVGKQLVDGEKVVIIEDVMTSGKALREILPKLEATAKVQVVGMVISVVLCAVFMFAGRWLVSLFSDVAFVVDTGEKIMRIVAVVALFQVVQTINTGCLRGAGDTHYTAVVSFFSIGITRPLIAYALCYPVGLGVIGAWIALFIDQTTRSFASSIRFAGGKWKTIKLG
jgi:O-antigen/teichoic acid export membrane protein